MNNVKPMLHVFAALDGKRRAYRDPEHDVNHLRNVYRAKLAEGNGFMREAQEKSGMARVCFEQAQRISEQLDVAEAELQRLRA